MPVELIGNRIPIEEVPTVSLHLRLPVEVKNAVREYAVHTGCSMNTAALTIINAGVESLRGRDNQ